MDKKQVCHDIAMATAKAFTDSNLPEYTNNSDSTGYAADMLKKYLEVYPIIETQFDELKPSKTLI